MTILGAVFKLKSFLPKDCSSAPFFLGRKVLNAKNPSKILLKYFGTFFVTDFGHERKKETIAASSEIHDLPSLPGGALGSLDGRQVPAGPMDPGLFS
jgi:hypothetical protein